MDQKKTVWLMAGIALFVLVLPLAMRLIFTNASLETFPFGSQPALHMILAKTLAPSTSVSSPTLFEGRTIRVTIFHYFLAFISRGNGTLLQWELIFLPIISGVLCVLFFQRLLAAFSFSTSATFMTLLAIILSPPFISTFTIASPDFLALTALLAGAVLFLSSSLSRSLLGCGLLAAASLFSLFHALIVLFFLFFYLLKCALTPLKRALTLGALVAVLALILILQHPFLIIYLHFPFTINTLVSDFGAPSGLSIFFLILLAMGLVYAWRERARYSISYLLFALLILAIVFFPQLLVYGTFAGAPFVGIALSHLKEKKWHFSVVGRITLFIIILGLLFSSLSYVTRLKEFPPSPELIDGLRVLHDVSQPGVVVLSVPAMGYFIEYYAGLPVFVDEFLDPAVLSARQETANAIFQSRNLEQARELLSQNDIQYLFITKEMKGGVVWDAQDQGILFLLRNSETFKNHYATPYVEIWEVIP